MAIHYTIRKTCPADLDAVMDIYAYARSFMAAHGNPRQWGATCWPPRQLIEKDIAVGRSYVCVTDDQETGQEKICAVFYYDFGAAPEAGYAGITQGGWKSDAPYGVVHRIAAAEGTRGAGSFCLGWAYEKSGHMRIDTHPDNTVMQSMLKKLGYSYCGIIYVEEDDDPRYAYEKL